ncbi:MAG: hypothetical protein AB9M53_08245 [Leptothrix sp. (in: b-proteobacteria)]
MSLSIAEQVADRMNHRTVLLGIAAIAFTSLMGILALSGDVVQRQLPIWFTLVACFSSIVSLGMQGWKYKFWHDQIADGLMDTAIFGLDAALVSFVFISPFSWAFKWPCAFLGIAAWALDACGRIYPNVSVFIDKEKSDAATK